MAEHTATKTISARRRKTPVTHSTEALRWALKTAGKTQTELAVHLGISKGAVSEIVNGTRTLTPVRLAATAAFLGCPASALRAPADAVA